MLDALERATAIEPRPSEHVMARIEIAKALALAGILHQLEELNRRAEFAIAAKAGTPR